MPLLIDLIRAVGEGLELPTQAVGLEITHITPDSRQAKPGTLFVALKGEKTDGAEFIPDAIQSGAVAALMQIPPSYLPPQAGGVEKKSPPFTGGIQGGDIAILYSQNPRLALAKMAAAFYPRQPEVIVAVTGTDGKTSTADFTRQLWVLLGKKAASIGTLGTIGENGQELCPGTHTTPDPMALHKMLQELADSGYTHIAMEASSHGLDQYRLHGVRVRAAAFTNLSRDHLDYHKTMEAYFAAKAKLFSEFPLEAAVINVDDNRGEELLRAQLSNHKNRMLMGYGEKCDYIDDGGNKWFLINKIAPLPHGQKIRLELLCQQLRKRWIFSDWKADLHKHVELEIPLVGTFQIYNMLAAAGLVLSERKQVVEEVLNLLPKLKGVPGRLEHVATLGNGAAVYIDYAHTPAALANILKTLRPHTQHKLHVVFGCGGDRDVGKRPEMGKAASELADYVIITDDNPRSEAPALIRAAIMAAAPCAKEVADRKQAIYAAIQGLGAGDVLVIAGKGHEKTQTIGKQVMPFDDAVIAREAVRELKL